MENSYDPVNTSSYRRGRLSMPTDQSAITNHYQLVTLNPRRAYPVHPVEYFDSPVETLEALRQAREL